MHNTPHYINILLDSNLAIEKFTKRKINAFIYFVITYMRYITVVYKNLDYMTKLFIICILNDIKYIFVNLPNSISNSLIVYILFY